MGHRRAFWILRKRQRSTFAGRCWLDHPFNALQQLSTQPISGNFGWPIGNPSAVSFTRQENLDEHLRRRHHGAIHDVQWKTTEISGPPRGPPTRPTFTPPAVVDVTLRVPTQPIQVNGANVSTDIVAPAPRPTTRLALALAKQEQELVHAREEIMANKKTIDENNEEILCLKRQLQAIEEFKPIGTARVDHGRLSPEDANSI
ncbi:hypothetical protein OHC33_010973 [Knufia fluminis]|uniref:Uncharacterized protein n=1 Tax=Knufia fluminis TaxID=191047 RepID=A0AAN8I257_9EURO|nr:hypothetical protein OHC33_010973 [Knufia fluminis]